MRALFEGVKHSPGILDTQEVATLEKAVFGQSPAPRSRRAAASRSAAPGPEGIDEVERAVFGSPAASTSSPAAASTGELNDATPDAAGSGIPEADRLFAPPTPEEAARILRELAWGEHIVGTRMAAAKGNSTTYIYSFQEAATFFLDDRSGSMSLGTSGQFAWIDIDRFVDWARATVGDTAFADVLEERLAKHDAYNDKIEAIRQLLLLRIAQFDPYLQDDDEAPGEEPTAPTENEHGERTHGAPLDGKE